MINNYDKKYNKIVKLEKSKWTSIKKVHGWKHYEVKNIDKKNNLIELFAICDKSKKVFVSKKELKDQSLWTRGWSSKNSSRDVFNNSLKDQLVDGNITWKQAKNEVKQIVRRKKERKKQVESKKKKEMFSM